MDLERRQSEAEFDAYSGNYDRAVNNSLAGSGLTVDFFTAVKAGILASELAAAFGDIATLDVLDVGCGIGNYHPYLTDRLGSITGVDVSGQCIATATARNPGARYSVYDGETLPFDDGSFDAAYAICVMHHVPPRLWPNFAGEMRRILKPGGLVLIFEHNPFNLLTRHVVSSCEFDEDAVLLRASRTRNLLAEAGFGDLATQFFLTVPFKGGLARRIDGFFRTLPFGAQYFVRGRA